ncbi:MAG: mannitol-1-phosphate 5-dehydrogenase [Armatimonadetes bacterium]|nr:mannitol-1-phosphate 5-dehydrogenase [Armatimonadota bacterium]
MKLLQFGAGNIGRSFIGQLFSRAGYEVVFVEVQPEMIALLNERRRYRVEVEDDPPATLWVENVRAVDGRDLPRVAAELASADIAGTAVGTAALPHILPALAAGLRLRRERGGGPLDVILCENLRSAAATVREGLARLLPPDFPLDECPGLVETSIGKMVPIMTAARRAEDPLAVYAEAYNTLICDAQGFRNPVPRVPGLDPKQNVRAYVDRKSFIHNLGHAVTAYVGFVRDPGMVYLWEAVARPEVRAMAEGAMWESARALIREYPEEFGEESQRDHIQDLLRRFANRALGDTVFRVGRDLPRKLSPEDRLIGALLLDLKQGVPAPNTLLGIAAALRFRARDDEGRLYPADAQFAAEWAPKGPEAILTGVCGLNPRVPAEAACIREVVASYGRLSAEGA